MATSTALPLTCPVCGWVFGLLAALDIHTHLLAHLVLYFHSRTMSLPQDKASGDW